MFPGRSEKNQYHYLTDTLCTIKKTHSFSQHNCVYQNTVICYMFQPLPVIFKPGQLPILKSIQNMECHIHMGSQAFNIIYLHIMRLHKFKMLFNLIISKYITWRTWDHKVVWHCMFCVLFKFWYLNLPADKQKGPKHVTSHILIKTWLCQLKIVFIVYICYY